MSVFASADELQKEISSVFVKGKVVDQVYLRDSLITRLVYTAEFSKNNEVTLLSRKYIREIAKALGIQLSSIIDFYLNIGDGSIKQTYTVPAMNVRALTYDFAQIVFDLTRENNDKPVIFEIAKTEAAYTSQKPDDFAVAILAAAIKTGYSGNIFLQADHMQFSTKNYQLNKQKEINNLKEIVKEFIDAGFYNIDIDASTLVDLNKQTKDEQQLENYTVTADMTTFIRKLQPDNIEISIGGEIGHIGGVNSTPEDLTAFMQGFLRLHDPKIKGLSKIAIQTGSSHGGIPLPDGSVAKVAIDFNAIENIGRLARETYHMGGIVQHGASTLPRELFNIFFEKKTLEIHLATGFQNILYNLIPDSLKKDMYDWLNKNHQKEWDENLNPEQNIYKTRKHALGPFKEALWNLPFEEKQKILEAWKEELIFLFQQLHVLT